MELDNYYKITEEELKSCLLTEEELKKYLLTNEEIEEILRETNDVLF